MMEAGSRQMRSVKILWERVKETCKHWLVLRDCTG